jgi:hypothetical protein
MADRQENPYLTATFAPRPTAAFNGIGVLADTQASISHAQEAINTFGYNLDNERDRAQQRVIKDTNYPYAVKQTEYMGQAGVLGAQGARMQAGSAALNQGLAIDQFDPIAGNQGITRDGDRILYGGIDAPTTANPTMTQAQKVAFNQRALDTPYEVGGDVNAQGQLTPLGSTGAAGPVLPGAAGPAYLVDPYNMSGSNIPGTPSSMVGITRQAKPQLRSGVTPTARDAAVRSVEGLSNDVKHYQKELAEANATLGSDPNWFVKAAADNRRDTALYNLERLTPKLTAAAGQLRGMVETPGPSEFSEQFNNYGIPQIPRAQGAPGADPIPNAPANATSYQAPSTMPPQLVPAFNNAVSLYTQHAPGGPGGTETGLLFSALESNFRPTAKAGTSSAAGMTQFTAPTWRDAAAKFKKDLPWLQGKTDDEIMALRSSPAHQAQMERALRMDNYAIAVKKFGGQFEHANPLNLYAMHHFGVDTGGKIAAALRKSPNTPISALISATAWRDALAANPYLAQNGRALTPAQLYSNWINRAKSLGFYGGARA